MKSLTTLTTLFYFTTLKMKSLSTPTTLFYLVSTIKMESLTSLTTLFYFTTIKMKSPTTLFYFTTIKIKSLTTLTTLFYFTTINVISLTTLTTLFKFTTIKMKPLTTLSMLHYFTTINPRDSATVTMQPLSIKYFSSQKFRYFHKICVCHSNFTIRMFSGVLNALLPQKFKGINYNSFFKFWPQNTEIGHFMWNIQSFYFLCEVLCQLNFT